MIGSSAGAVCIGGSVLGNLDPWGNHELDPDDDKDHCDTILEVVEVPRAVILIKAVCRQGPCTSIIESEQIIQDTIIVFGGHSVGA